MESGALGHDSRNYRAFSGAARLRAGALAAFRQALIIAEALAAHDPVNVQWQLDVVASCIILGMVTYAHNVEIRREYLLRGRGILVSLERMGRLQPNQNLIEWIDARLAQLV